MKRLEKSRNKIKGSDFQQSLKTPLQLAALCSLLPHCKSEALTATGWSTQACKQAQPVALQGAHQTARHPASGCAITGCSSKADCMASSSFRYLSCCPTEGVFICSQHVFCLFQVCCLSSLGICFSLLALADSCGRHPWATLPACSPLPLALHSCCLNRQSRPSSHCYTNICCGECQAVTNPNSPQRL